ncbi:MAG: hypothetical protein M1378_11960 [Bacteroidetes bacterium]|nr:hypothetical protein [Bacteroidota bacterium]
MDKTYRNILMIFGFFAAFIILTGLAWFGWLGPRIESSRNESEAAIKDAGKASRSAENTITESKHMVFLWETLQLDANAEMERVRQDADAHRVYNVNNRRDPEARAIAADIDKIVETSKRNESALRSVLKRLENGNDKKRVERDLKKIIKLKHGMEELQNDIDVFGFYALSLAAADQLKNAFKNTNDLILAARFEEASQSMQTVSFNENEVALWRDYGNQEITNIGGYGKDSETILKFMSGSRNVSSMLGEVINAGIQGDQPVMETGKTRLNRELADLDRIGKDYGFDGTFKTWFLKNAHRYVDGL